MHEHEKTPRKTTPATSLIAWLSVCLMAAALGNTLERQWQLLWAEMGAFGLASAVGLEAIYRVRKNRASLLRNSAARARLETGLSRLNEESATLDALNAAVRRLADHAVRQKGSQSRKPGWSKRHWEAEMLSHYPLEISPVDYDASSGYQLSDHVGGSVQQISSTAISFDHDEPLSEQVVLVIFKLAARQRLAFVVDVIWTEQTSDGFISGGTLLAVGVPREEDVRAEVELRSACG